MTPPTPSDYDLFRALIRSVIIRCFGQPPAKVPSESECRYLSLEIEEKTGLVIGWKSLKNYAAAVLDDSSGKTVNPSAATLDTLARYALEAPPITEGQRKKEGNAYAYWFQYREQVLERQLQAEVRVRRSIPWKKILLFSLPIGLIVAAYFLLPTKSGSMEEHFQLLGEKELDKNAWLLVAEDQAYWERRDENTGQLTLFTLKGDSWRTPGQSPRIPNLLCRALPGGDFSTEVHFSDFIPQENWQQAGILLMEDTLFNGKSLRISLSYNDYFGGLTQPGEILIQVVASNGRAYANVEEVVHHPLFTLNGDFGKEMIDDNLKYSALKVERQGENFRFLYSASPFENFSFKELTSYEFNMEPKYVGIFALKGFVDTAAVMPVSVRFFRLEDLSGK